MSQSLRQQLRQIRQSLSPLQQIHHAEQATLKLLRSPWLQRSKHIAVFLSQKGELSTEPLIQALWQRGHHVYLPVLNTLRGRPMAFAPFTPESQLLPAKFGIPEPMTVDHQHRFGNQLEVVITPLVGFDEQGHRIGMGGGFYDRTFAFKRRLHLERPKLIGWAHECQKVAHIDAQPWDVPLDAIVTEKQIYRPKRNA
ncbi:5-formyltetrahydrofolate cyclo-ligase [Galenea microaerophila]